MLIVEDAIPLSNLLAKKFRKNYIVDQAFDVAQAHYLLDTKEYDVLILDLVLPDGNGLQLVEYLRENNVFVPTLFLSAEADVGQKVACLEFGQVDYLQKPFNFDELSSRVRLLLRKATPTKTSLLKSGTLELDIKQHQVFLSGQEVTLNRKEFLLLQFFLQHPEQIISKVTLAEKIWQDDTVLFGNSIETTIASLRSKLSKKLIKTIKGVGYSLNSRWSA